MAIVIINVRTVSNKKGFEGRGMKDGKGKDCQRGKGVKR